MTQGVGDRKPRVLLVDDDDVFRRGLARTLERDGYDIVEAATAQHAREQLVVHDDIVALLCDVQMPGESGLALLKELTADRPDLAVVMVTGVDDQDTAQAAFDIGAFGYLTKPVARNEILVNLAGALTRRELEAGRRDHVARLERTIDRLRTLRGVLNYIEGDNAAFDGETTERLARALALRDEETGGHIERMSRYAEILAAAVGIDRGASAEIRLVTALHDVGKIGISDSILLKPGRLTADEYAIMQRHAQIGHQLMAGASSSIVRRAADTALCHHEWWDGGGYPHGLRGEEIPVEARIAAVTDVFDALTSHRVYRAGLPVDESLEMMTDLRGRQFEPRLLDAFVEALPDMLAMRAEYPDWVEEQRVRVLIVDDHDLVVQSLVHLLAAAADIKVVGTAGTVASGVRAAIDYEPDVVLMDFELPDGTGVEATRRIKDLAPRTKVVMLTGRTDRHAFAQAIEGGCAGFVTKTDAAESLTAAIRAVYEGEAVTGGADLAPLLRELRPTSMGVGASLSPREVEILGLIAEGLSNKEIAQRLVLSLNTVRNHVQRILSKLHAHSKLEAVAIGVKEGVLDYSRAG